MTNRLAIGLGAFAGLFILGHLANKALKAAPTLRDSYFRTAVLPERRYGSTVTVGGSHGYIEWSADPAT